MRHAQGHISPKELLRRRIITRLYVQMTTVMHSMVFGSGGEIGAGELEALIVLMCIFVADADGRPATVSKIAAHAQMPRATVYRKLKHLMEIGKIERYGRYYCYAPNAITVDTNQRLAKVLDRFCQLMSETDSYKIAI